MVRNIGSFRLWTCVLGAVEIDLEVTSSQGLPQESVSIGTPFLMSVAIKNPENEQAPTIEGLKQFRIIGHQSEIHRAMHQHQLKFIYTVVAKEVGTYTIGPARSAGVSSETKTLKVVEAQPKKKIDFEKPSFALKASTKTAVIGEKIPFTLRFEWQDPQIEPVTR